MRAYYLIRPFVCLFCFSVLGDVAVFVVFVLFGGEGADGCSIICLLADHFASHNVIHYFRSLQ